MEREPKRVEFDYHGEQIILEIGRCAVFMFRRHPEMNFLFLDGNPHRRIFNELDWCDFVTGRKLVLDESNELGFYMTEIDGNTFRSLSGGWNPDVYELEQPDDEIREIFISLNTPDDEWK